MVAQRRRDAGAHYCMVGTLGSNNDIRGPGLDGDSWDAESIEDCEYKCTHNKDCKAFMYDDRTFKCKLAKSISTK